MKLVKRLTSFSAALFVSMSSLFVFGVPHAFAVTATWTGGGGVDTNMNNAANWGGTAPLAADDLVFPANITNRTVVNNYVAGTVFNSITFSGVTSVNSGYTITGNAFVVTNGITSSMTGALYSPQTIFAPLTLGGAQSFTNSATNGDLDFGGTFNVSTFNLSIVGNNYTNINGVISGSGNITKSGTGNLTLGGNNSSYTGAITISAGRLSASAANALANTGGTIISDGAEVYMGGCDIATYNGNLTLNGASSSPTGLYPTPKLTISNSTCSGSGSGTDEYYGYLAGTNSATFTGSVILGNDITFATYGKDATLTGALSGAHSFKLIDGYGGALILNGSTNTTSMPNGTYRAAPIVKVLSDALPESTVTVTGVSMVTIDGTRKDIYVSGDLAVLKGTGTVASLTVSNSGTVAPGHSPGTLTVTGAFTLVGVASYQAEIKNTTEFDQIKAGSVVLGAATASLNVVLVDGYGIKAKDTFMIINNTGSSAVTGTFKDLAEGATFKVGDGVFKITYKGGDGNDVVLSIVTVPSVGNTGFKLLASSPYALLAATVAITAGAYVLSRRYAYVKTK